jgi:O-antigen/teichoic acid export membrane protein
MSVDSLTQSNIGDRALARSVAWNLAGQILPLTAAIFAMPILIDGLGIERFGVLTLAWVVIGYFSLFDLGLGRALTKLAAEKIGQGQSEQVAPLTWTALWLMSGFGVIGALVILGSSGWIVSTPIGESPSLHMEAANAYLLLAWSVPPVLLTAGLRGLLEAYHRFDLVNAARIPVGVLNFLLPVAVLPLSNRIDFMVAVLLGLRILMGVALALLSLRVTPALRSPSGISGKYVRQLLSFGGWMTVTNIVGPLMVFGDRFLIGALLGAAAVAYYATPHEVITKLLFVPGALVATLFPVFAATLEIDRCRAAELFQRGTRWILMVIFPPALIALVFAEEGLRFWISDEFARQGAYVMKWLAAGVLLNSLAQVPFTFVQASGRPDLTAKLHLVELPLYFICLWLLMQQWGVVGVAAAWTLRAAVDAVVLTIMALRIEQRLIVAWRNVPVIAICMAAMLAGAVALEFADKMLFVGCVMLLFVGFAWRQLLSPEERTYLRNKLTRTVHVGAA